MTKDSPTQRNEDERRSSAGAHPPTHGAADRSKSKDQHKAEQESQADSANKPGGFQNDPDDSTNPNEVRDRQRRALKP